MLSLHLIGRHFYAGDHARLLRAVTENGLDLPAALHPHLADEPAATIGLALRRLAELTYGPTPLTAAMTTALLEHQRDDGGFGGDEGNAADPLATAAAVAALHRLGEQPCGGGPGVALACERALAVLAATQDPDGLFRGAGAGERGSRDALEAERALVGATVLLLLGDAPAFYESIRVDALCRSLERRQPAFDAAARQLYRRARVSQPRPVAA